MLQPIRQRYLDLAPELRGILIVIAAMMILSVNDAFNKHFATIYPPAQVVWLRFSFALPILLLILWRYGGLELFKTERPLLQLCRIVLFTVQMIIALSALRVLPLADTHALLATTPLFVTALSMPILGEAVGRRRWNAVVFGFIGALIIIQPGLGAIQPAALLAILAAIMFAFMQFVTRIVARVDGAMTTFALQIIGVALVLTLAAPLYAVPIPIDHIPYFIIIAFLGALGHYCLIAALSLAPAVVIQPFTYSVLIFATIVGFFVFGDFPDLATIIGGLVIAFAGILAIRAERAPVRRK